MTHTVDKKMILMVGTPDQEHTAYIHQKLADKGARVGFLNTLDFPRHLFIAFNADEKTDGYIKPAPGAPAIALDDIHSVYWRFGLNYTDMNSIEIADPFIKGQVYQEVLSALGSFFHSLDCLCVDPLCVFERQFYKPYQIKQFKAAGIRVPDSLVTNDVEAVYAFFQKHGGQVVYKPCWALAEATRLEESDLYSGRFNNLCLSPVTFQELIPGTDILAYVLDGEIFATRVIADTLDFRVATKWHYEPLTLPDPVAQDCLTITQMMGSNFLLIDVRCTPDGEYVFLDGTPNPKFMEVEQETGYPLSDRLVDLLLRGHPG